MHRWKLKKKKLKKKNLLLNEDGGEKLMEVLHRELIRGNKKRN